MIKSYQYGLYSEARVCKYLEDKNYTILETRLKTPYGEVDIIAEHDKTIVFIEVKARNKLEHMEMMSPRQIKRISAAANHYIATCRQSERDIRFDFILLKGKEIVSHIENAWEYAE